MHIWTIENWKNVLKENVTRRDGLRFRYDKSVDLEVKNACVTFAKWMRSEYYFPLRVVVYVKGDKKVRTKDGDKVVGSFFEPVSFCYEPYIRIATGDYNELKYLRGRDNALASILATIAHELTHYYQWINNLQLTSIGIERQATQYSKYIIDEYAMTHDHP